MPNHCYHCSTSYPPNAERCSRCGLTPEHAAGSAKPVDQSSCPHSELAAAIVGGYTCGRCGLYLFRKIAD
jgi:hypothetical protein